jgi:cysteine desulfuration protein SufE
MNLAQNLKNTIIKLNFPQIVNLIIIDEKKSAVEKIYMQDPAQFNSCLAKQHKVQLLFDTSVTPIQKYEKIIELGRELTPYPALFKTPDRLVKGCQSTMYLYAELTQGKIHFHAFSEALISAGLAALLLAVYNGETPDVILTCPPRFLEELGVHDSLSPSRSNGLASLFQRMKKEALDFLIQKNI